MSVAPLDIARAVNTDWPETSCYLDLWATLVGQWGGEPRAMAAFVLTIDWEGDQFTFLKPPAADLQALYGVTVQELSRFGSVEQQVVLQLARKRIVLLEVDSYYLPDTQATSYRRQHTKTTIGITALDPHRQTLHYVHNAGVFSLDGEDYAGLFRPAEPGLPLFAEIAKMSEELPQGQVLQAAAMTSLRQALAHVPTACPIQAMQAGFETQIADLLEQPSGFDDWAFNTLRQLGAGFERLGGFAGWLAECGLPATAAMTPCLDISATTKTIQFRTARMLARKRFDPCAEQFAQLSAARSEAVAAFAALADRAPA